MRIFKLGRLKIYIILLVTGNCDMVPFVSGTIIFSSRSLRFFVRQRCVLPVAQFGLAPGRHDLPGLEENACVADARSQPRLIP